MIEVALGRWAEETGRRFAVSGTEVLGAVRAKLEGRRDDGLIDEGFFRENLGGFGYLEDCGVEDPEAILLVSAPRPAHVVSFGFGSGVMEGLLPPTYVRYRAFFVDILAELKDAMGDGTPVGILRAPLKSLSVHMGLSVYGRNNITYVPGFGSYHQLCGYAVGGEAGRRLKKACGGRELTEATLERCATCRACMEACPTGAIRKDRFLISVDRCFTLYSERRGALPAGIRPSGPVCLVGCLACQEACPENAGKLKSERLDVMFTADETEALLELGRREAAGEGLARAAGEACAAPVGVPIALWTGIMAQFDRLDISEEIESIARNLLGGTLRSARS